MSVQFKCPNTDFISEEEISKLTAKELWYRKRQYCLSQCDGGCGQLEILKKIYWELRKPE